MPRRKGSNPSAFPPPCPLSGKPLKLHEKGGMVWVSSPYGWHSSPFPGMAELRAWSMNTLMRPGYFVAKSTFQIAEVTRRPKLGATDQVITEYQPRGRRWFGPVFPFREQAEWWARADGTPKPGVGGVKERLPDFGTVDDGMEPLSDNDAEEAVNEYIERHQPTA